MAESHNEQVPKTGKNSKSVFASRYVSLDLFVIPQKGRIDLERSQGFIGLSPAPVVVEGRLIARWDVIDLSKPVDNRADSPQILYALAPRPGAALYRFGSRVRGNATPWSDSDFLILQPDDGEDKEFRHGKISLSLYRMSTMRAMAANGSFFVQDVLANHQHLFGASLSLSDVTPSVRRIRADGRYPIEMAKMLLALSAPAIKAVNTQLTSAKLLWCARSLIFCRGKNPFCLSPSDAEHRPLLILKDHAKRGGQSSHDISAVVRVLLSNLGLTLDSDLRSLDDLRRAFASDTHPELREILDQLNAAETQLTNKSHSR